MPVINRSVRRASLEPSRLTSGARKYTFDQFRQQPVCQKATGSSLPTGATGDVNWFHTHQCSYQYSILGAGQTLLAPTIGADGLLYGLDLTDNEGVQIVPGGRGDNVAIGKHHFTIGSASEGGAFFVRWRFKIADVSGVDEWMVMVRKVQAFQTAHTGYTDYAAIGIFTAANPADVKVKTRLNSGTAVTTDTLFNWADGETHELEIRVDGAGRATFKINNYPLGAPVRKDALGTAITAQSTTAPPAFTFDSGDTVHPEHFALYATTAPGALNMKEFECGPEGSRA